MAQWVNSDPQHPGKMSGTVACICSFNSTRRYKQRQANPSGLLASQSTGIWLTSGSVREPALKNEVEPDIYC